MNAYEELRKAIMKATDGDNSRGVTKAEFCEAMQGMADPLSHKEAAHLFNEITNGGFGKITTAKLDGYLDKTAVSKAIHLFKDYKGKDRYLDEKELCHLLTDNGMPHSKAKHMFGKIDTRGDGKITLVEFRDWASELLKVSVIEENFNL